MKQKIVNQSSNRKQKTDWDKLWANARRVFASAGMDRQQAVFDNFDGQKEEICRVMNIVSMADVVRIQRRVESDTKGN